MRALPSTPSRRGLATAATGSERRQRSCVPCKLCRKVEYFSGMEPSSSSWTLDPCPGSSLIHHAGFHGKCGSVATKRSSVARRHMCCRCTPLCDACHTKMPHALRLRTNGRPNPYREDRRRRQALVMSPANATAVVGFRTSPQFKKQKRQRNFNRLIGDAHLGEASHPGPLHDHSITRADVLWTKHCRDEGPSSHPIPTFALLITTN